jgi:hypothetical protein
MTCIPRQLNGSVAGRWYEDVAGRDGSNGSWSTRVSYYQALENALGLRSPGEALEVRDVVARHPKGAQSTFYNVASRKPLLKAYQRNVVEPVRQVTQLAPGLDPLNRMLVEAQVWSFWDRRRTWISWIDSAYPTGDFAVVADRLVREIHGWRAENQQLASVGPGLPLSCVEDVVILSRGRVGPRDAALALNRALEADAESLRLPPAGPQRLAPQLVGGPSRTGAVEACVREALEMLRAVPEAVVVQKKLVAALNLLHSSDCGN